jgi:hypothetical protein
MPKLTITPGEYLDTYVAPLANALGAGAPLAAFRAALFNKPFGLPPGLGLDPNVPIEINIPDPFPSNGGGSGGSTAPPTSTPAPGLTPIDPALVLAQLSDAVRGAETLLNKDNLAIAHAKLDIDLSVAVGGLAAANAHLAIQIGPTPTA